MILAASIYFGSGLLFFGAIVTFYREIVVPRDFPILALVCVTLWPLILLAEILRHEVNR
jgi:vacuolar-type H+-ATPase subunit I/STV1